MTTIKLPKDALSTDSENGEGVTPSVGDQVDLTNGVGMVVGEEGDNLVIEIKAMNGHDCNYDEEAGEAPDEAGMRASLEKMDVATD